MTTPIIKTATVSDEAPAIAVVVLAFSADPAARWTWPDPHQYLMHFPSSSGGSVLKVEMVIWRRGLTALTTAACGLSQAAYLHI